MKIYIVRHGQAPSNVNQVWNITDDLTEKGINQAEELADKIQNMKFDVMYYSDIPRAEHTAKILNSKLNLKMIFDERIRERNPGSLVGQPLKIIDREDYWNYNSVNQYGTSENIKEFFGRVNSFIEDLKEKDYNSVIIVTHKGVSKAFSAYFEGIQDGLFWDRGIKNCEIKEYEL